MLRSRPLDQWRRYNIVRCLQVQRTKLWSSDSLGSSYEDVTDTAQYPHVLVVHCPGSGQTCPAATVLKASTT